MSFYMIHSAVCLSYLVLISIDHQGDEGLKGHKGQRGKKVRSLLSVCLCPFLSPSLTICLCGQGERGIPGRLGQKVKHVTVSNEDQLSSMSKMVFLCSPGRPGSKRGCRVEWGTGTKRRARI